MGDGVPVLILELAPRHVDGAPIVYLGPCIGQRPFDGQIDAARTAFGSEPGGGGIGAGDEHEVVASHLVRLAARREQPFHLLFGGNEHLAGQMTATPLGLILQVTGRHANRNDLLHEHLHLAEPAVAVLHVHDHGQPLADGPVGHILLARPVIRCAHHAACLLRQFRAAEGTHVGHPVLLDSIGKPAQIGRLESRVGGELDTPGVIKPRREDVGLILEQPPQQGRRMLPGKAKFQEAGLRGFRGGCTSLQNILPIGGRCGIRCMGRRLRHATQFDLWFHIYRLA